jgi:hypothetical protein
MTELSPEQHKLLGTFKEAEVVAEQTYAANADADHIRRQAYQACLDAGFSPFDTTIQ